MALAVKLDARSMNISVQSTMTRQLGYSLLNFSRIVRIMSVLAGQRIMNLS